MPSLNNPEIIENYKGNNAFYKIFADGTIVQGIYFQMNMHETSKTFNLLKKIKKIFSAQVTQSGNVDWILNRLSVKIMSSQFTVYAETQAVAGWLILWGEVDNV